MYFPCGKVYQWFWWKKSTHTLRKKMDINFPGSPSLMDFAAFSHVMGNWRGNPCISHIIKYTMGCESNGKKAPMLWEKYEYKFLSSPHTMDFVRFSPNPNSQAFPGNKFQGFSNSMDFSTFFHAMGNLWENLCISHMMRYTTVWESRGCFSLSIVRLTSWRSEVLR